MNTVNNATAVAPGDEHPSFMQQLIDLRRSHIVHNNLVFNETMKDILSHAQANPRNLIQNLKDELRAQVSDSPEKMEYTVIYTIDMSALLQEDTPITLWYHTTNRHGNLHINHANIKTLVALDRPTLYRYILRVDPQIQQLRTMLRSQFPDARIVPTIEYQHWNNRLIVNITIIYALPAVDMSNVTIHTIPVEGIVSNEW